MGLSSTLIALLALVASAQTGVVPVVVETELGNIEIDIDTAHAPVTSANFLRYVDAGLYDGGLFHRSVKSEIEVVQAARFAGSKAFPAVRLERTSVTGLAHRDGTISMARTAPDSAVSDFFICIGDQPSLDFGGKRNPDGQGFAAFGRVTKGMEVVRKIQARPADDKQHIIAPVKIFRIARR